MSSNMVVTRPSRTPPTGKFFPASGTSLRLLRLAIGLSSAAVIYGLIGDPLPDSINAGVILVGLCLALTFANSDGLGTLAPRASSLLLPVHTGLLLALVVALALVGTIVGSMGGATSDDLYRDIVAHSFLLLPVLVLNVPPRRRHDLFIKGRQIAIVSAVIAGHMLALRYLAATGIRPDQVGRSLAAAPDKQMLQQDPLVLLAAVLTPFLALTPFAGRGGFRSVRRVVMLALVPIPMAAFLATGARLSVALTLAAWVAIGLIEARHSNRAPIFYLAGAAAVISLRASNLGGAAANLLIDKARIVGDNGRIAEWTDVITSIGASSGALIWGFGFGSIVHAPSNNTAYSFTHSIFSYYWFKTGTIGLILLLVLLLVFADLARLAFRVDARVVIAVAVIFVNSAAFQAAYKPWTFGFALAILAWTAAESRLRHESRPVLAA